jgi:hypothetical protein
VHFVTLHLSICIPVHHNQRKHYITAQLPYVHAA